MPDKHNGMNNEKNFKNTDNESTMYIPGDSKQYQQNAQQYSDNYYGRNVSQQNQHQPNSALSSSINRLVSSKDTNIPKTDSRVTLIRMGSSRGISTSRMVSKDILISKAVSSKGTPILKMVNKVTPTLKAVSSRDILIRSSNTLSRKDMLNLRNRLSREREEGEENTEVLSE